MTKYPAYSDLKESGLAWVGAIPSHWQVHRLKNLFQLEKRPPRENDKIVTAFRDGEVTLRENRRTDGFTNSIKEIGYQGIRTGDLVIHAMDAFAGAIGVSDADGKATPVYSVATPRTGVNVYYFGRMLRYMALSGYVTSLAKGIRERSTEFRWADASVLYLPLPPISEQRDICLFIDRETAKIDALIEEQQRLIELLKEKRQAVISHAVTKGLDPSVPMKDSGVEWLGQVPAHWEVLHLRRVTSGVLTGGTPKQEQPTSMTDGQISWFTPGDFTENLLLEYSEKGVTTESVANGDAKLFPAKCVLIVGIGATLGKVGYIEKPASANQQINILIPNNRISYCFLAHTLLAQTKQMKYLSNAATIGILNQEKTKEIIITLPILNEQKAISDYLTQNDEQLKASLTIANTAIDLLQERRAALISAAVTGKIDVRGLVSDEVVAA
jgi:type I restriction enzyme S subunit